MAFVVQSSSLSALTAPAGWTASDNPPTHRPQAFAEWEGGRLDILSSLVSLAYCAATTPAARSSAAETLERIASDSSRPAGSVTRGGADPAVAAALAAGVPQLCGVLACAPGGIARRLAWALVRRCGMCLSLLLSPAPPHIT